MALNFFKIAKGLSLKSQTGADPTGADGDIYYNATLNQFRKYENGSWGTMGGSGSGSGEINAVTNGVFTSDKLGWTDGTSHTSTRVVSGSPLDPLTTTALSIVASTTAAESSTSGTYYTISSLPTGLQNRKLKVEFYFTTTTSQTWAVSVYQGSTRKVLSTDASGATLLPAGVTGGKFTAYFDTDSSTSYTINLTRTAGAGSATLIMTNMIVGPGIQPQGAVISEVDVAYTTSGMGTITNSKFKSVRKGSYLFTDFFFIMGTTAAATVSLDLPAGYTIDYSKLSTQANGQVVGFGIAPDPSGTPTAAGNRALAVFTDGTITNKVFLTINIASAALTKATGNVVFNNNCLVTGFLEIPIAEWAGSGTLNTAQNDVEYAANSFTGDGSDTTSFVYGPQGSTFPGIQTGVTSNRRVRFKSPIQVTDKITLQYQAAIGAPWIDVVGYDQSVGIHNLLIQNSVFYGMSPKSSIINATDLDITFGRYQYNASATYGGAGTNWSTSGGNWRVKKETAGVAVGFGIATNDATGLITSYAPKVKSSVNAVSADYTITTSDGYSVILVTTGATGRTITLPLASANTGRKITIKKVDSGVGGLSVARTGSDTIDGATSLVFAAASQGADALNTYATLVSDGTNWKVIDEKIHTSLLVYGTAASATAGNILAFTSVQEDTHSGYSAGTYTVPTSGTYQCSIGGQAANGSVTYGVYRGGVLIRRIAVSDTVVGDGGGSITLKFVAGDTISFRPTNATSGNIAATGWASISKVR